MKHVNFTGSTTREAITDFVKFAKDRNVTLTAIAKELGVTGQSVGQYLKFCHRPNRSKRHLGFILDYAVSIVDPPEYEQMLSMLSDAGLSFDIVDDNVVRHITGIPNLISEPVSEQTANIIYKLTNSDKCNRILIQCTPEQTAEVLTFLQKFH